MTAKSKVVIIVGVLVAGSLQGVGWAQADPAWLKAWQEAYQQRPAQIPSQARIASDEEPGTALVIQGSVVTPAGEPASDVLVHAYHRDHEGFELGHQDRLLTTWELNGWARTDKQGRFGFETVRPAVDHLGREAAHIHFTLVSEKFGRQWATKIFFSDDALISDSDRRKSEKAGDYGGVRKVRIHDDTQHIDVHFRLKEEGDF